MLSSRGRHLFSSFFSLVVRYVFLGWRWHNLLLPLLVSPWGEEREKITFFPLSPCHLHKFYYTACITLLGRKTTLLTQVSFLPVVFCVCMQHAKQIFPCVQVLFELSDSPKKSWLQETSWFCALNVFEILVFSWKNLLLLTTSSYFAW